MKCLEFLYFYLRDESAQKEIQAQTALEVPQIGKEKPKLPVTPERKKRSFPSTPKLASDFQPKTEPGSPTKTSFASPSKRLQGYGLFRKEIDFVPTTPRKPRGGNYSVEAPPLPLFPSSKVSSELFGKDELGARPRDAEGVTRSSGEKKEILRSLVGNVDALVEGVGEAGIFGLS